MVNTLTDLIEYMNIKYSSQGMILHGDNTITTDYRFTKKSVLLCWEDVCFGGRS